MKFYKDMDEGVMVYRQGDDIIIPQLFSYGADDWIDDPYEYGFYGGEPCVEEITEEEAYEIIASYKSGKYRS